MSFALLGRPAMGQQKEPHAAPSTHSKPFHTKISSFTAPKVFERSNAH